MVIVTGAAGFIGSHVCRALLQRGEHVLGVDNFDPFYDRTIKERVLASLLALGARRGGAAKGAGVFEFAGVDVTDPAAVRGVMRRPGVDGLIHLAAKAGVRPSVDDPVGYARANVLGTAAVLDEAKRAGLKRAVIASSSSVYGNGAQVPFAEDGDVDHPISPYAASKRACEVLAYTHWVLTKMPVGVLRFFTVYGPGQRPDLAIATFMRLAQEGRPIPVFGPLESSRDYTYVGDIARGVLAAYDRVEAHGYRAWNLGGSRPVTLARMIETIGRAAGRTLEIVHQPRRVGDVERTCADPTRSAAELDFRPSITFEEGIERQWAWATGRAPW